MSFLKIYWTLLLGPAVSQIIKKKIKNADTHLKCKTNTSTNAVIPSKPDFHIFEATYQN